jgi:hypothetical protein
MLINGGLCRWHLRRDGTITIREILSTKPGAGRLMLRRLGALARRLQASAIVARCPADLKEANKWYHKMGFCLERTLKAKTGRRLHEWHCRL